MIPIKTPKNHPRRASIFSIHFVSPSSQKLPCRDRLPIFPMPPFIPPVLAQPIM